ncbi:MAG: DNA-processing protein DprA [Candidatus Omnitrophica bacterium]|nr:DNA-processing protein DprA [Candidatus Omnitrophota bacterium]MBU2265929.1 DNA-processing protein DprA [Candidatus Omnitrophota bacterium]
MPKKGSLLLNLLNFSGKKIIDVIKVFPDPDLILEAGYSDLSRVGSLTAADIEAVLSPKILRRLDQEMGLIEKHKVNCLDIFDAQYPDLLKEISHPPLVLYVKGDLSVLNKYLLAIVGSRKASAYGLSLAGKYSTELSKLGIGIVSGLARGIDTATHQAALKNGRTVAVLGSGLLNVYPKENTRLFNQIVESGAVVSEFPLGVLPHPDNFPRRNRIVSGLTRGVLVVEAAQRSGALITARLACEQNREVFALPGGADSLMSKGTHQLIKQGAKLVDCLEDIIEELNLNFAQLEVN